MSCSSSGLVTQISQVSDQADLCHTPWLFMSSEFLVHFEGIHKLCPYCKLNKDYIVVIYLYFCLHMKTSEFV